MKINTIWWQHNSRYVKAWISYTLLMLAVRFVFQLVFSPFLRFSSTNQFLIYLLIAILTLSGLLISFLIFRASAKRFLN